MEEGPNSWIWRTKYSHTVCHRWESLRLSSVPFLIQPPLDSTVQPKADTASSNYRSTHLRNTQMQGNHVLTNQRSLSPFPKTKLSEALNQAHNGQKRFSTPNSRWREPSEVKGKKVFIKEAKVRDSLNEEKFSPLRQLASLRANEKRRFKKESSWTKFFEHGGGRVTAVEAFDELAVDLSKLFIGHRFAHGAHSRLYHGVYNDEAVAVKIISLPDDDENGALAARLKNQFSREVTLLSRLHHPNIITLVSACRQPPVHCIITEYLSEGSLRAYLHKLEKKSLPLQKLIAIALDVARGMEYIHSQGIIHRDLKPENVLIDQNFCLKIADFGIACEEAQCDTLADDPGTYRWMAPEMIKRKSYGRKVDVYSFGLMLWEMVTGTVPYEDMTPVQAAFAVVNKNMRPDIRSGSCPSALQALIEQCWSAQPEKRPEFWHVVKVLEQFEAAVKGDGSLRLVQKPIWEDHKKGRIHWIQKLGHIPSQMSPMPKPKFI